ncbi:hypothetical protein ArV1_071 [Arthrobacter phage vB_ArtM-ArV1]|uniref:Uncharacterized protein n=1 Tax=Arthrobacter phage vB_ArtM-ArV1 TaxID=1566993 RepID=A0A0A7HAZ1_9CAUD|nr:hypothetical protein ArV1_071 [Arthrobacter phage vB_ArtM-ArV1]AIZ01758.1 hypothetical protein ArV1_071 [Arthrobacter phage vB_ArtM-ArV1]
MSLHMVKAIEELADKWHGDFPAKAAELRAILERYPLPPEDADERDSTHWLFQRHSETLTRVANAVNGPPKPLWSHSHHDLGEKAEAMASELNEAREKLNPGADMVDAMAADLAEAFNIPSQRYARQEIRFVLALARGEDPNDLR